jgi:DNA-binding beta-propeller fold protein YncE
MRKLLSGCLILALLLGPVSQVAAEDWAVGDVFVGVSNGTYMVFSNAGVFKEQISQAMGGFTTGCAFDPLLTKLYTTNFSNTKVVVFNDAHPHTIAQVIDTNLVSPGGHSESVVFDALGNFYVGHPDGNDLIHKYDATGILITTYSVSVDYRGTDWIDLSADQATLFYTSEGRAVQRFDTSTNTQLAHFAVLAGAGNAYALRLLPPGDGSGGLLVADGYNVKRLDGAGNVVQIYDVPGEDSWFALNLDPNGTAFWSGNFNTSRFYRFNIATGLVEVGPIETGTSPLTLFGICVKGELTAAQSVDGRMTGGGKVVAGSVEARYGFELHSDVNQKPNNLQVTWTGGNRFHLESLETALCTDDPNISEGKPVAGFDTYKGTGTGRLNGVPNATVEFEFTDAGEPGVNDTVKITIKDATDAVVLSISGHPLKGGNHQAHGVGNKE